MAGSELSTARPGRGLARRPAKPGRLSALRPAWSGPAAMRAVRAALVVPALFALTFEGAGNLQMALFATFGAFASLVMAAFGGTRRDKMVAHLGLAVAGSVVLTIGTAVSGTAWLAAIVTIPVAFGIFFAGVAGPNAASGVTAALLAYVLPVATPGAVGTIPSRLAGWWLAAAVSTAAVLLLSPRSPGDRLRAAAARSASALAGQLEAAARGQVTAGLQEAATAAKHELIAAFAATPYRPTGLATSDQALASVVQELEWCTVLASDALDGHLDFGRAAPVDLHLLGTAADVLRDAAGLLAGHDREPDLARLEGARAASAARDRDLSGDPAGVQVSARQAFHAQVIALAARAVAADTLITTRRAPAELVAAERRSWSGGQAARSSPGGRGAALASAAGVATRHASIRSVWFLNSLRGAVALAAAVAVADVSGVQHGFWVVLGTLSVLRTNAAGTGATVLRALLGTAAGFVLGAALLLGIGTGPVALWVALPIAVLFASYAPGTMPFVVGQAAFTITVVVLFNLLVPAGWTLGLLRIEDVAIGCAVSLAVGILFWPRGAASVVGDDLADAFRRGGAYLTQAVDWALGLRRDRPDAAMTAVTAGLRLDEALRAFLAEQGAKRLSKDDLWSLVMASLRLRLTAESLAGLCHKAAPADDGRPGRTDAVKGALHGQAAELDAFYQRVASQVGRPVAGEPSLIDVSALNGHDGDGAAGDAGQHPRLIWVREHLHHLAQHAAAVPGPALRMAQVRRLPWWR